MKNKLELNGQQKSNIAWEEMMNTIFTHFQNKNITEKRTIPLKFNVHFDRITYEQKKI